MERRQLAGVSATSVHGNASALPHAGKLPAFHLKIVGAATVAARGMSCLGKEDGLGTSPAPTFSRQLGLSKNLNFLGCLALDRLDAEAFV